MEHSQRSRPTHEASPLPTAKVQPPGWGEPQIESSPLPVHDFSHVDFFSHAPQRSPVQLKLNAGHVDEPQAELADRAIEPETTTHAPPDNPQPPNGNPLQPKPVASSQRSFPHFLPVDVFTHAPQRSPVQMNPVQTKLTVGAPNDVYEQEADRVAQQVMSMAPPATPTVQRQTDEEEIQTKPLIETITPIIQRQEAEEDEPIQAKCEDCQAEEPIQRFGNSPAQAQPDLENRLNASQGGGNALPDEVRSFIEPRFGVDFSGVRVHTGSDSVQMNRDLNAQAFTHQQDIYFGSGKAPANDTLTAHELTHVAQQSIGCVPDKLFCKSAIYRQLDSTPTPSTFSLLTKEQINSAKEFYKARKQQYTPDIIQQIQNQVGTTATGTIDTETIQAIAQFQQSNSSLKVDGKAGPRTLPAAFPTGLADEKEIDQYVDEAKQTQTDWVTLGTADERANKLLTAVNKRLDSAGVPPCKKDIDKNLLAQGSFDPETWTISISARTLTKPSVTDEESANLAETLYHEGRHAEQQFMVAQMLAGKRKSAKEIVAEIGIDKDVAEAASKRPLQPGSMAALIADGWYESGYGSQSAYRVQVMIAVRAKKKALKVNEALEEFNKNPTPENEAKKKAVRQKFEATEEYKKYRDLPEEADAHRVGGEAEEGYLKK